MKTILVTFEDDDQPHDNDVQKLVDVIRTMEPSAKVRFGFLYSSF